METDAYQLGHLDAAIDFGLKKEAWAKAVLPMAGAAMGALMAPEGAAMQGAVLGGTTAFAGQTAAMAGANKLKSAFTPKPNPHAATPGGTQMAQTAKLPEHLADLAKWNRQENAYAQARSTIHNELASTNEELSALQQPKAASLESLKLSVDISAGVPIPGLGASIGVKDQRERLPGMSRWVPRSTVERGFDYVDQGLDLNSVAQLEGDRHSLTHPLIGAALAAAGARKFMPNSGVLGPLLSGLLGAGLGSVYNQSTKDRRVEEGLEAVNGAQRERDKFPIRRHATQTANESTPLAVSRGNGDA